VAHASSDFSFPKDPALGLAAPTNTPVFAIPDNGISDPTFGVVSSTVNTERQLQLALKFYF